MNSGNLSSNLDNGSGEFRAGPHTNIEPDLEETGRFILLGQESHLREWAN